MKNINLWDLFNLVVDDKVKYYDNGMKEYVGQYITNINQGESKTIIELENGDIITIDINKNGS